MLSDPALAQKNAAMHAWTTARITALFRLLQQQPSARPDADIPSLAQAMDTFFWSLLVQAPNMSRRAMQRQITAATHLIFHSLFRDTPGESPAMGRHEYADPSRRT